MTRRYEYKYTIENTPLEKVLDVIRFHSAGFVEAFPQRQVNNFYMDTLNLDFFYQNMDGISRRRKFRYRWYGPAQVQQDGQLETKNKENEMGWKDIVPVPAGVLASQKKLNEHFMSLGLSQAVLRPTLYNNYKRYYFVSADGLFRLTVDYDQHFGRPFDRAEPPVSLHSVHELILELKFDEAYQAQSEEIRRELPFLRTKNSKYANGVIKIYG